jgi:transcriptional regulator with XRE-family HTH domain
MAQSISMNRFKHNLKIAMKARGITQADLASVLNVKPPAISRMLNTREGITIERAEKLATAVGMTLSELFSENNQDRALTAR